MKLLAHTVNKKLYASQLGLNTMESLNDLRQAFLGDTLNGTPNVQRLNNLRFIVPALTTSILLEGEFGDGVHSEQSCNLEADHPKMGYRIFNSAAVRSQASDQPACERTHASMLTPLQLLANVIIYVTLNNAGSRCVVLSDHFDDEVTIDAAIGLLTVCKDGLTTPDDKMHTLLKTLRGQLRGAWSEIDGSQAVRHRFNGGKRYGLMRFTPDDLLGRGSSTDERSAYINEFLRKNNTSVLFIGREDSMLPRDVTQDGIYDLGNRIWRLGKRFASVRDLPSVRQFSREGRNGDVSGEDIGLFRYMKTLSLRGPSRYAVAKLKPKRGKSLTVGFLRPHAIIFPEAVHIDRIFPAAPASTRARLTDTNETSFRRQKLANLYEHAVTPAISTFFAENLRIGVLSMGTPTLDEIYGPICASGILTPRSGLEGGNTENRTFHIACRQLPVSAGVNSVSSTFKLCVGLIPNMIRVHGNTFHVRPVIIVIHKDWAKHMQQDIQTIISGGSLIAGLPPYRKFMMHMDKKQYQTLSERSISSAMAPIDCGCFYMHDAMSSASWSSQTDAYEQIGGTDAGVDVTLNSRGCLRDSTHVHYARHIDADTDLFSTELIDYSSDMVIGGNTSMEMKTMAQWPAVTVIKHEDVDQLSFYGKLGIANSHGRKAPKSPDNVVIHAVGFDAFPDPPQGCKGFDIILYTPPTVL